MSAPARSSNAIQELDLPSVQRLLDALPFYAMVVDETHTILAVNTRITEAFHKRPEELVGEYCPLAIHGSAGPYRGCPLERVVADGAPHEVELYDEDRGSWTRSAVYPLGLYSQDGSEIFLHFAQDITEHKEAEQARGQALEHNQALRALLERLQGCETDGEILGCTLDLLLELSWMQPTLRGGAFVVEGQELHLVAERNFDGARVAACRHVKLGHCLCGHVAQSGEPYVCTGAGDALHRRESVAEDHGHVVLPLSDDQDVLGVLNLYLAAGEALDPDRHAFLSGVISIVGVALRRRRMHDQLVQNQYRQMQTEKLAALGTLVAGVAHEVNNPLAGLKNCQRWLCREDLPAERRQEYLGLMEDGLNRIQRVMEQLLNYSRLRPQRWGAESLWGLVCSTCDLLRPALRPRRIEIALESPAHDALVLVDSGQIEQALTNLLLNAIYVTPDNGSIQIGLRRRAKQVAVDIRDHGSGIPEAIRSQIEDPFFTTKPEGKGTGLGLSVTRTIVDAHQGSLTFDFPADGGTVASIWLNELSADD